MLVLSRKEGERLVIGENITLVVSKIVGNRVTIGIEAPKNVKVMRAELMDVEADTVGGAGSTESTMISEQSLGLAANRSKASISLKDFTSKVRQLRRQVG